VKGWEDGKASKGWGSCQWTGDKGGWVFATTNKEAGSPSKLRRGSNEQAVGLDEALNSG
jgi:hypothetical protein